jgi:hypothetical protein
MNRLKTIVLFAGIFAIGLGAISLNDSSAESLSILAATPQTQNSMGMLGHVEYKLMDAEGSIKQYLQSDNTVVNAGMDCVSRLMFDNDTADISCTNGLSTFDYISIGNVTSTNIDADVPLQGHTELESSSDGNCATTGVDGEMARKRVTPTFTAAVAEGSGTLVVLDTKDSPFDFGVSNSTSEITQSGIFNADVTTSDGEGQCTALGDADMFAIQNLATQTGIAVSSGDSLSVKWTITVG